MGPKTVLVALTWTLGCYPSERFGANDQELLSSFLLSFQFPPEWKCGIVPLVSIFTEKIAISSILDNTGGRVKLRVPTSPLSLIPREGRCMDSDALGRGNLRYRTLSTFTRIPREKGAEGQYAA